ncbi:hypothetical protein [Streptomyces roseochromogenus]|uniref:Uncharacterized protein n=1 Tax=Streptomyces roseochromogenus subsp. oscitans DS 12.976 TaxID=1352936 RepID=V6KTI6_STRRC|nr:hypothetical protein [Streptomyces roseochromogenus]EST35510.1 hypothetical protein M878_05470 [Streptomyces roseochromogenus subsp. oscitans DS 12.976]
MAAYARTRSSLTSPLCSATCLAGRRHHRVIACKEPLHPSYAASGTGLLPSPELDVNAAWLTATTPAADLSC